MVGDNMLYTSPNNKQIKELKKLKNKKYRDKDNKFLVEGEHLVQEAYKAGLLNLLILEENATLKTDIPTIFVTKAILKELSSLDTPPKVLGVACKKEDKLRGNRIVILDNVQDPGNLGTIIRSAVAFNIDTVILSNDSVDIYNPKVIRATQGMIFKLNIIYEDLTKIILELKNKGFKIFGTDVVSGKELKGIEKCEKFAIIMGNEGKGMTQDLKTFCDDLIYIPMNPLCESLNVGVATSIILYEFDK